MYTATIKGCKDHDTVTGNSHDECIVNIKEKIIHLSHEIQGEQTAYLIFTLPATIYFWHNTGFTASGLISVLIAIGACWLIGEFVCFFAYGQMNVNKLLTMRLARKRWRRELTRIDNLDSALPEAA
jgi:hypothetical protein